MPFFSNSPLWKVFVSSIVPHYLGQFIAASTAISPQNAPTSCFWNDFSHFLDIMTLDLGEVTHYVDLCIYFSIDT